MSEVFGKGLLQSSDLDTFSNNTEMKILLEAPMSWHDSGSLHPPLPVHLMPNIAFGENVLGVGVRPVDLGCAIRQLSDADASL